jgi:hypothetical protein
MKIPSRRSLVRPLRVLLFALLFSALVTPLAAADQVTSNLIDPGDTAPVPDRGKWRPWLEFGAFGATDEQSRGEATLFLPSWQDPSQIVFVQGTARLFEDDVQEGNLALGYRRMTGYGWNLGIWGGWDIRHTEQDNTFQQAAFGVEALGPRWDFRVNGYVPISDPERAPGLARARFRGGRVLLVGGEEVPLHGIDGEVGLRLFRSDRHELRVFAGGFYFDDDDALDDVSGPRGRLQYTLDDVFAAWPGSRLTVEGEYQHDEVREGQFEGGLLLRIPLGRGHRRLASLSDQERRMVDPIVRDVDIVTTRSDEEPVFDTLTGVELDRVAMVSGTGALQTTIDTAGPKSLIIVQGGAGDIAGGAVLQPDQTLQGGGSDITVTGRNSRVSASFAAPGTQPRIVEATDNPVLTLASNTHTTGVQLVGAGAASGLTNNHGIFTPDDVMNVAVTQSVITDTGGGGILFGDNSQGVLIDGMTLARTNDDTIRIGANSSNIVISNTQISDSDEDGIEIDDGSTLVTIEDVTITDIDEEGIEIDDDSSNVTMSRLTISNTGSEGIDIDSDTSNVAIRDTTIFDTNGDGIDIVSNNTGIVIENVSITNPGDHGIDFDSDNTITISNTTISGSTLDGINGTDRNTITIRDTTISNAGGSGISILNDNVATISGTIITNPTADGIVFNTGNQVTVTGGTIESADFAINVDSNNQVTLTDVTINNADTDAIAIFGNNQVVINATTISGLIGDDVLDIAAAGNTLNGAGNINNAMVTDKLCEANAGDFTGIFEISGVTIVDAGPPCAP